MAAVCVHFRRRGVDPGFEPGREWHLRTERSGVADADRSLRWLSDQVAPSVKRVVAARGFLAAWHALGLAELVDVDQVELEELLPGLVRRR
jgi:hypothetical protein